ncbi:MAG: Glycerol-3-phosphate dehydrogenase [NAD(P)+] [Chlamydiia bacterium]|nr:Glycerol-3-phosphate dehydrogenase [NAD(P)+] [Chlamydiia bacterium]
MKVGFLGSGIWGMALVSLLIKNNHEVLIWSIEEDVLDHLQKEKRHPKFKKAVFNDLVNTTKNINDIKECDVVIECVTAKGLRSVLSLLCMKEKLEKPFILSSKGIETHTGEILSEIAEEILGKEALIGILSGPTLADEVLSNHPTCAVAGSRHEKVQSLIKDLFESEHFNVQSSYDLHGVALGGAMKNVIAIACGMSAGLNLGYNTTAMLLTKGLQELKKMAVIKGCKEETMNTLSGLGDLIVTGVSPLSRNFRFGKHLGEGLGADEAKKEIGMVVEGEYTVKAAYALMVESDMDLPITKCVYNVLNSNMLPMEAIKKILHCYHEVQSA